MTKKVTKKEDIEQLRDAEFFVIEIPGLPDDPEQLLSSPGWLKRNEILNEIKDKFKSGRE